MRCGGGTHVAIQEHTRIQLARGVRVFVRAPETIQFGADATRTGLITVPSADEVVTVLDSLTHPRMLKTVVAALAVHLGEARARSLIDDLITYRLLIPTTTPQVLVVGRDALASQITLLLSRRGVVTRSPMKDESVSKFLLDHEPHLPVLAVNCAAEVDQIAAATRGRRGPVVPVTQFDARVVVGPVCAPSGPCPVCARLYLLDRDPNIAQVEEHLPPAIAAEPVSLAAGAVAAATVAGRLAGALDPPGVSAPTPVAGDVVVADPFAPVPVVSQRVPSHPDCPMCF